MKRIVSVAVLLACLAPVPFPALAEDADPATRAWEACREKLTRALRIEEEKRNLPRSAWFRRDRNSANKDIDALLDDALEALAVSPMVNLRARHAVLETEIREARGRVSRYSEEKIFAPESTSALNPFSRSRKDYERKIDELRTRIDALQKQKDELVVKLQKEYAAIGVALSREQVRFYLSSVSGEDIVGLSAVFNNVKELDLQLAGLIRQDPGNTDSARRYYGVHVVLIRTVMRAHEAVVDKIEDHYIPRIADLARRNRRAAEETQRLLRDADGSDRGVLEGSARAQEVTGTAIEIYAQHLKDLRERVSAAREELRSRYDVARNAYDTIMVASSLVDDMTSCIKDLGALQEMHLPEMLTIDSDALQVKFDEITAALSQ